MEQPESPSQSSHLLINPPSILFPQILKLSVDVGGMVSIVGITEEKNLQVHHHLQTEISHAEYEEDLPELATGVVVPKLNENELEDPMSLAQTVALSLINIMENNQYLLGILHFECNGFESVIDFNENRQIEIDPMPLCEAFLKGRLEGATPDLLNNPPPPNISVFFHHENLNSIFKFAWKQRSDLFVLLERIAGSAYGIGTFEKSEDEWALHLYVLEDDLSETGQRGTPQPYPETWNELKEKIVAGAAFPIVWFRVDVGYPFAFSLLEEWDNAKQLSILVNAKERYDEYAVESMKGMTMTGEGEEGEDLPGLDKKSQKRFKAFTEGKLDPKKDMQMALDDMKGAMKDLEKLIPSDWNLVEDKVVTISETDPDLWYSKAFAARTENNLEDAKSAVEKAIGYERDRIREDLGIPEGEPFPENLPQQEKLAKYLHEYGIIFLLNKEPNEALVAFKNARIFDPANSDILK
ncbi:MAG TPA: hypothetical protein VKK79_01275, partial [Candidatus Lokiarchaeia archaeon]|nr:hypothetical protein [Candidatus Lokiarchaeia archaeon]